MSEPAPQRQTWNPERYIRNAGFVAELGGPVFELLAPQPGERILDLGCGDGRLTERLVEAGCTVVGVDASAEQIEAARSRGLDAHVANGEALTYEAEFDAVFSNAALHWMRNAPAVIAGVRRALRPGGRFVAECGGIDCAAAVVEAVEAVLGARGVDAQALNPWYFPSAEEYRPLLEEGGFAVDSIAIIPRPTPLEGHLTGWLETFCESFMEPFGREEWPALFAAIAEHARPRLQRPDGTWFVDYTRLRFAARMV